MSFCLNCLSEFDETTWSSLLGEDIICPSCKKQLKVDFRTFKLGETRAYCLYDYQEGFRNLLYRFKGCRDIALSPVFLCKTRLFLKILFSGYVVVPAPSHHEDDEERGFNHVYEIAKTLGLPVIRALEKTERVKQAGSSSEVRREVRKRLKLDPKANLKGKKVLFMDDVITTGSTAKACISLIKGAGAKKVTGLFLARVKLRSEEEKPADGFS